MTTRFLPVALLSMLILSASVQELTAESRVVVKSLGRNLADAASAQQRPLARAQIFEFAGKRIETTEDFKAAVLTLPRGTELFWDSGCIMYRALPVAGPRATIVELQQFCAEHGVRFVHSFGY